MYMSLYGYIFLINPIFMKNNEQTYAGSLGRGIQVLYIHVDAGGSKNACIHLDASRIYSRVRLYRAYYRPTAQCTNHADIMTIYVISDVISYSVIYVYICYLLCYQIRYQISLLCYQC